MVAVNVFGAAAPPGAQSVSNEADVIEFGNVFYVPAENTSVWNCVGGRIYLASGSILGLESNGMTAVTLELSSSTELGATALRTGLIASPVAGWNEVLWDSPYIMDVGTAYVISARFSGSSTYYVTHPSPGAGAIAPSDPVNSPVYLAGETGYGATTTRSTYRIGAGGSSNGGGVLYGVDILVENNDVPADAHVYDPAYEATIAVKGWLRSPSNTGLASVGIDPDVDLEAYDGPYTTQGLVYRKDITVPGGTVFTVGPNSMLKECRITTSGDPGIILGGVNSSVVTCDLVMPAIADIQRVGIFSNPLAGGENVLVRNVKMTGATIQVWIDIDGTVQHFYGYDQAPEIGGAQHRDGFTCRGGVGPLYLLDSRFECDEASTTGAFFLQGLTTDNIFVEGCMFEGSGYCMTLEDARGGTYSDIRINPYGDYSFDAVTRTSNFLWDLWEEVYYWADLPVNDYKGDAIDINNIVPSDAGGPGTDSPYGWWWSDGTAWTKVE